MQASQAWDIASGAGATVAVLDTGLNTGGEDTPICVLPGIDIAYGDNDPSDGDSHGTHVSGTIAQATNNGLGVAGLAHGACILPVKVLDDTGSGGMAEIAEGIYWAVDNGADVINMSLGISARYNITHDAYVDPALDYAYSHNVTVVAASGNDGNRRNVGYPAIYPSVIAVGATDANNKLARYSNRGTGLDLMAPGGDTGADANGDGYADGVLQETFSGGSWGYYFFQGTSMASPHVAAAAAVLLSAGVATTPDEIESLLKSTALDLGSAGVDSSYGAGLIQLYSALTEGVPPPAPVCGDGTCNGSEDCSSCDIDCGLCPPPPPDPVCGDNSCNGSEDCSSCAADCGVCPPPPPACFPSNASCDVNSDCCSGNCRSKGNKTGTCS